MADGGHGHAHGDGCDHGGHHHAHAHIDAAGSSSSPGAVPFPLSTSARAHRGDDGDADLPRAFARAEALFHHVVDGESMPGGCGGEDGGGGAHDEARHVRDGVAALLRCAALVRSTGAVSSNECAGDMRTEDLRYLLVEYYAAGLRQRVGGDPAARLAALEAAAVGLEAFVADCVARRVVPAAEAAALGFDGLLQQRAQRPSAADTADADDGCGTGSTRAQQLWAQAGARTSPASAPGRARQDVAASRSQKIERYKRNVEAKKRLKELALHHARLQRLQRGDGDADGVGTAASLGAMDEDGRRELTMLTLQMAARSAIDELASVEQEMVILRHQKTLLARTRGEPGSGAAADSRMDPLARQRNSGGSAGTASGPPADDISVDPARKGLEVMHVGPTFEAVRQVIKADVFTSGHRPPTMSMEDWGDIVTEKRIARESREALQTAGRVKTLAELAEYGTDPEADIMAHDAAQERQRRYDDWADGVPRGAGVTKRV